MKKLIVILSVLMTGCGVSKIQNLVGHYTSPDFSEENTLVLNSDSTFILHQPNSTSNWCENIHGQWYNKGNNIFLTTDIQEYYKLNREKAKHEDSIIFEIIGLDASNELVYPFTEVYLLDRYDNIVFEGKTDVNSKVILPAKNITKIKLFIPRLFSTHIIMDYFDYIEKGYDYKLEMWDCNLLIWNQQRMRIKDGFLTLKVDEQKCNFYKTESTP